MTVNNGSLVIKIVIKLRGYQNDKKSSFW